MRNGHPGQGITVALRIAEARNTPVPIILRQIRANTHEAPQDIARRQLKHAEQYRTRH